MSGLRLAALLVLAALAGGVIWKSLPARTAPVEGPNPISELIPGEIGGMTKWLLIRGADREAPILLWLHGGPGVAQMPIHSITGALERDVNNMRATFGRTAPELLETQYAHEIWPLFKTGDLKPDTPLTGRFVDDSAEADVGAVMDQIEETRRENEARLRAV
jgi:hypothetical protein